MNPRNTIAACIGLAALSQAPRASAAPSPPPPAHTDDDLDVPAAPVPSAASAAAPATTVPPVAVPAAPLPSAASATRPALVAAQGQEATPVRPDERAEIQELRARLDALEAKAATEPAHPVVRSDIFGTAPPTTSFDASPWSKTWPLGFTISGYVQAQYQHSQLSADELSADGTPLNQDRFLVRRARLRVDRGWEFAFATLEVDGNNNNGLAFGLRRAEGALLWRAKDPGAPPLLSLRAGLTDIPFGYELYEPNRARLFMERTTASRAFFAGDQDFGAQLSGAYGVFRAALGVFDGTPVSDSAPAAAGFDLTSEKDFIARFGVETQPSKAVGISGGASFINGTGLHQGTVATKGTLQWSDLNGNGVVDPGEVTGLPGQSATPSVTFSRWTVGVDLQLRIRTPIGRGLLYGEAYIANNYDRGLDVADPVATGVSLREVGWYAAYVQEITRWGLVGLRVDSYNPNSDFTAQRGASLLPVDQTITTFSPLVGLVLPDHARLVFQYDRVLNQLGLSSTGVPTQLAEDQWVVRLQVEM